MAVGEWRIQYPGVDLSLDRDDIFLEKHPEVGFADLSTDDADNPRGDGRRFGEDFLGGSTIALPLMLHGATSADVDVAGDLLRSVWRGDSIRRTPGAVAELRSPRGRAAIGRPRRYIQDDQIAKHGLSPVTATFDTVDSLWYGDEEQLPVPYAPAPSGGIKSPLKAPLSTTRSSTQVGHLVIGGDAPTPLLIDFAGPITNPELEILGFGRFAFATTLAYDGTLALDGRPWIATILRDGAAAPGTLTPSSTPLTQALIPPGSYAIAFRGISPTATAQVTIRHRPAFASY